MRMPSARWVWWDGGEMLWLFCAPRLKASGKQHIQIIQQLMKNRWADLRHV
jgi:hypothetical protein